MPKQPARPDTINNPGPADHTDPHPGLRRLIQADPDLVDRMLDYMVAMVPEMADPQRRASTEHALRSEFGGQDRVYVRSAAAINREAITHKVLSMFNGRNATEIARCLKISRATVYRCLKQPG